MSDTHEPQEEGNPNQAWQSPAGWAPPPPPADWAAGNGNGWRDPSAHSESQPQAHPPAQVAQQDPPPAPQPPSPYGQPAYGQNQYGQNQYGPGHYGWGQPAAWGGGPGGPGGQYPGAYGTGGWGYGWTPAPARPRRSLPHAVTALLLVVAVLVGLGLGHGVWRSVHNNSSNASGSGNSGLGNGSNPFGSGGNTFTNPGAGSSGALSGAAATAASELVDINTSLSYQNDAAAGTGIVLTSDGYVLTNNHVISGATSIKATDVANGQTYTATVVGYDRTHDVAVIKLDGASGLKAAKLGDSAKVSVGDAVTGLGNAGGVGGTPSSASGHVTALDQSITAQDESNSTSEKLTGLIQTDANIQPGDSGGALIDQNGNVIGMDTAASTGFSFQTQGNQGFAIPINSAVSIANQIRNGQASSTVHLGKTAFLGVEVDTSRAASGNSGATISSTIPGGAADQAGITGGDVITSLGGSTVDSPTTLTNLIGKYHPGDKVPVTWTDSNGQSHTATVTLANGPAA